MSKISLIDLANLQNENTAVSTINTNNHVLSAAIDNALSLNGTVPNSMLSNFDMNSNQILNLPSPATVNSPARLIDVMANPNVSVPPVGTSGATVPLLNGNNTWSGTNTFNNTVTLPSSTITNNILVNMANNTVKGNVSGGSAAPSDLTATQLATLVNSQRITGAFRVANNFVNSTYTTPNPNAYQLYRPSTTLFNINSCWSNNRFTPPNGTSLVHLDASIWVTSGAAPAAASWVAKWIKNFTVNGSNFQTAGADVLAGVGALSCLGAQSAIMHASGFDQPSNGDYYGLFVFIDGVSGPGTTITIDGNPAHTYLSGAVIY